MTRYVDAITSALRTAMLDDPSVLVLGQDVTVGGPFGATNGLVDAFGAHRVVDTPISESAVMGAAVGAATTGARPVVEVMFMDFITLGLDQLVNHAAKLRYMSGGQLEVPLTVRVQAGAVGGYGAQHSQSLEAWLAHVPGLRVVAPVTASDAFHLLLDAVADPDPVVVLEHRSLYWTRGEIADNTPDPRGVRIARAGTDVTVAAYSAMVPAALAAAEQLSGQCDVEVVDLRSISPLDLDGVLASVRRTGRLVIAHEAVRTGGIGAELAALVHEHAGPDLKAAVHRVGAPWSPMPAAVQLERAVVPNPEAIVAAVRIVLEQKGAHQ